MFMTSALLTAALLDWLFGEPRRLHPLVGFGRIAAAVETRLNRNCNSRLAGVFGWLLLIAPVALVCIGFSRLSGVGLWLFNVIALYGALAYRSWRDHLLDIHRPLQAGDLAAARLALGRIVSRDTGTLDAQSVRKGAIESGLENGADGIFAPLFWFVCLGGTGAVLYRLINTLDAMWGYKNARYRQFGWCAARMDDLANWLPARLTATAYCLLGQCRSGWRAWRVQAHLCPSPNAGPVMAAGAGALDVQLGGRAIYQGVALDKPALGTDRPASNDDVLATVVLVKRTYGGFLVGGCACFLLASILETL